MKKTVIITAVILLLASLVPVLPTAGDREVYEKTLRLHVIANSDSTQDQEMKLQVRDAVLDCLAVPMEQAKSRSDAVSVIEEHKSEIESAAAAAVADAGGDYPVSVELCKEYYPRKEYEGVTLPAGDYLSLQVKIGENAGANWWCVLFPTLCTSSAEPKKELTEAGFTVGQVRLITESSGTRYKLKLKLLELFR